jgi:phospholipid/cholesterol/gamma-HCH transport system substrate-binding protein
MDKNAPMRKFIAGIFFLGGLVLIGMAVLFIGMDRGLTQSKFEVIVLFNEVGGLVEGSPIRLSGVNVGVVKSIDFLEQPIFSRSLKVTMSIFKKYEFQFSKCSRISIKTEGVLGQKIIEIHKDAERKPFDLTRPLIGQDPLDVENMAAALTKTAASLESASEDVSKVIEEWKFISHKTRRLINRVEEKVIDGSLFKIF